MTRLLTTLSLIALLSACGDGNPLFDADGNPINNPDGGTGSGTGDGTGADGDEASLDAGNAIPPGTEDPSANNSITRFESRETGVGAGLVTDVSYNASNDTFRVDNLGFDGANVYRRNGEIRTLGGYAVYAADDTTPDFLTGDPVGQIAPYRTIFGRSGTRVDGEPRTSFAIVRTGGYAGYGFGGFLYERNGGVVLPDSGQAQWTGRYAGLRVFDPIGGLEYTRGDAVVAIDFEDFNANDAVIGRFFNREAFDETGAPISLGGDGNLILPPLLFVVQEGGSTLTTEGEIQGELRNSIVVDGAVEIYEDGFYYGVIAGDTTSGDGGELTGIFVVESDDPRYEGVTAQETGGFILNR